MMRKTTDVWNLVSKLTLPRAWNMLKIAAGYAGSRISRQPVVLGLPASVSIEPTTSCNLRCPECPSGLRSFTRPTGMMDETFFRKVVDEISRETLYMIFYFQGEPFLNPSLLDMVRYASSKKIYTATSTNAHYLDSETARRTVESGIDRLIISIDGTTDEVYRQYRRGGSLEKVLEGTRNIVRWREKLRSSKPYVIFQFLVVKPNEHQVEDAKSLARELGVDEIVFKTAQIYDYAHGNPLIPDNGKYSRYKKTATGAYTIKNKLLNHCWRLWRSAVITWDGKTVPCCFDKDASHSMGDLQKESFQAIWKGESYRRFRKSVLTARSETDICTNCTEGTTVFN